MCPFAVHRLKWEHECRVGRAALFICPVLLLLSAYVAPACLFGFERMDVVAEEEGEEEAGAAARTAHRRTEFFCQFSKSTCHACLAPPSRIHATTPTFGRSFSIERES